MCIKCINEIYNTVKPLQYILYESNVAITSNKYGKHPLEKYIIFYTRYYFSKYNSKAVIM